MSGPKAFTVVAAPVAIPLAPVVAVIAAAALAAGIAARASEEAEKERLRKEELRREEERRQVEQERLRRIAAAKAAAEAVERKRALDAEVAEAVSSCQIEIESSTALLDSRFPTDAISTRFAALQQSASKAKESASIKAAATQLQQDLHKHIDFIKAFRAVEAECADCMKTLNAEKAVQTFSAAGLATIRENYAKAVAAPKLLADGPEKAAENLRRLASQSRSLVTESLTKESNFEVRNKLLQTTIGALQSLGFFVADPEYSNPADPLGNVALTATRGAERVVLSVPLVGDVQSDWQGVPEEPCKGDFFAFLDKLEEGGFPCKPTRPDLQERPKLIRKGEKQLPGNAGSTRTA
jgi:hypothetical protein